MSLTPLALTLLFAVIAGAYVVGLLANAVRWASTLVSCGCKN